MARLSGLSLAPKMAAALGAGVLALSAIGAGAAAAVTQSPNPAAWGQHVQQAVEDCKKALALQPGEHGIGACGVGNAQAALESTIASVKERSTNYTGAKMREFQAVQLRVGAAGAKIDAARLILRNDCLEAQEIANRKQIADLQTKLRFKRNLAYAVTLCTEAVDSLHAMAGANGIYETAPLERIFRDAHSLAGHISFSFDAQASGWGLVALGGEVNNPTL